MNKLVIASRNRGKIIEIKKILRIEEVEYLDLEALEFNKPIPFASHVLQNWSEEYKLAYVTARSRNMQDLTLDELEKFCFTTVDVDLMMLTPRDWRNYFASRTSHVELRTRLFSSLSKRYRIA